MIGVVFSVLLILAASVWGGLDNRSNAYDTMLMTSGGETSGTEFDDTYSIYLTDESFGTVEIVYVESIGEYMVHASFTNTGETGLVLESPDGEKTEYALTVERYSYSIDRIDPPGSPEAKP